MFNKICSICGKEFETNRTNKKYCSSECGKQGAKIRDAKRRGNDIIKDCPICGERFEISKNGALTKYCSQHCSDEAIRIRNRDRWREANPGWYAETDKVCEWCGKAYEVRPRNASQSRFCSDECAQTQYSREIRGCGSREEWTALAAKQRQERLELLRRDVIEDWTIQEWEYIRGYTEGNSDIQMRCLHCNKITTIKIDEIINRKTYDCTAECIKEVKHKQEQAKLLGRRQKKKEEWETLPVKTCVICGKEFKSWQPSQVTCSNKCSRNHANRKKRAYDKANKFGVVVIDNDITVERLFERDKGICHLCGDECNHKDFEIRDGHFVVGKSYPSIDHVIPRSKGGVHSWENVKLAHHYCNTIKNNHEDKTVITRRILEMAL